MKAADTKGQDEMTSSGMDLVVNDRIHERLQEAERERLARMVTRDRSPQPPRGPLFAGLGRRAARLAHVIG
jgi:hypothetical protein